ncbi:MAG: type II secretion system protein [Bdellovibrionaceae bacterium]|nr:type II secretion system protein [Pseudobdellovibrionaceae bacterium]
MTSDGPVIKNEKGFSLIEVLIALTILMGSLIVVSQAWTTSQARIRKMKMNNQAAFLLDYKVADMEKQFSTQLTLLPDEASGNFEELGAEYKSFTWIMSSKKFELPDLTPVFAQQRGGTVDPMLSTMMTQISDYFNKAAKEVTITVIYTLHKNSVKFSATTFLVDFNQQLPIPNLGGGASNPLGGQGNGP